MATPLVLPRDALQLGWFVINKNNPLTVLYESETPIAPSNVVTSRITKFRQDRRTQSYMGIKVFFTKLFRLVANTKERTQLNVEALDCTISVLKNPKQHFREACKSIKLHRWFEEQVDDIGGFNITLFMITGIHLAKNVKLIFRASDKKEKEAAVTIPVAELLGDPGILGLGKVLDVGGSVTWDSSDSDSQSFEADEFIYGVNYTKVKVHFYSPKDLEKLSLSTDSVWKYMSTDAGEDENSDEEAVNMVNLELAESSEVNAEEGTVYEEDFEFPGSQSG